MNRIKSAFTLFELLLAVSLSAALLMLLGAAINLYLLECNTERLDVEEAQLARVVLDRIAADIRGAFIFEPQKMDRIARAIKSAAQAAKASEDDTGASGSSGSVGSSSQGTQSEADEEEETSTDRPHGVYGNLSELMLDIRRLPRAREWAILGAESAVMPAAKSDVRTVRWAVREGDSVGVGEFVALSNSADQQQRLGGLVRQQADRAAMMETANGDGAFFTDLPGDLMAPEVVSIQFRYFNGQELLEVWDSSEQEQLPQAIEVKIFLRPLGDNVMEDEKYHEYALTVDLPLAKPGGENSESTSDGGVRDAT